MNEIESVMDDSQVYEVSFIFDNRLPEARATEKLESLKGNIASLGGSFISEETPYMRELSYEMTRVVNNVNIRFNSGYFGWVKFEMDPANVEEINKKLKLDEEIVRFLVVKAKKGNDVFTKDISVIKSDPSIATFVKDDIVEDVNVDTTTDDAGIEGIDEEVKKELDSEIENLEN